MDQLVEAASVARITPKGSRHTVQSIGRVAVGDDKVMQERLGHADAGVALGSYTYVMSEQHRAAGRTPTGFRARSSVSSAASTRRARACWVGGSGRGRCGGSM
jgi:integrase